MSQPQDREPTGVPAAAVPAQTATDTWAGSAQARWEARMAAGFAALENLGPRPPADLMKQVREDLHGTSAPQVAS